MIIDISKINNQNASMIEINSQVDIPSSYYENTDIINLKNLIFSGYLENLEEEFTLKGKLSGIMVIEDAINLDPIDYEFNIDLEEEITDFLEKSSNTLDITEILWQNIMLEVPLKLTKVESFDEYHGDGWKLVSEDSIEHTNNPFKELEEMLREE